MATASSNPIPAEPAWRKLPTHWRVLITMALVLHLTAIISAPWSGPEPGGPLANAIASQFRQYLDATYSGHGYRFFAPEPGPSRLVRYTLTFADGNTRSGQFPDRQTEWPRLLYHRHFMLSEKLAGLYVEQDPTRELPPEARRGFRQAQELFENIAKSYAMHLLHSSGAKEVNVELVQHMLPIPPQVERGMKLTDPSLYRVMWQHTYQAEPS
jgi:hypothetical protein